MPAVVSSSQLSFCIFAEIEKALPASMSAILEIFFCKVLFYPLFLLLVLFVSLSLKLALKCCSLSAAEFTVISWQQPNIGLKQIL